MINTPPKQIKGLHSYHPQPGNKFPTSRILNSRFSLQKNGKVASQVPKDAILLNIRCRDGQ